MASYRSPLLALIIPFLLALGGCDDGTSPGGDLGDLDAADLVGALNELVAPLEASNTARANLSAATPDLTDAGIQLRTTGPATTVSDFRDRLFARAWLQPAVRHAPFQPLLASFPPEVVGKTFVHGSESQRWSVDGARSGAPSDGVRVMWYTVDGTGRVRFPLDEQGYIDLRPGPGEDDGLVVRVVETGEVGGIALLDFVRNRGSFEDDIVIEWFTAAGHYSDGPGSTEFEIASEESVESGSEDATFDLYVGLDNSATRYSMQVDGTKSGATGDYEDRITTTLVRDGGTTILDVTFRGNDESQEDASGTLVRNGTLIANINVTGNNYDFATPDGGTFSAGQANDLNALFNAMTLSGFLVLLNLPLVLP